MNRDADHDSQNKPRQGFAEFVRDSFLQQFGMASVAKSKLLELIHFAHLEYEKGPEQAHPRVLLLYRLMGLRESTDDTDHGIEGLSFILHVVQELYPSWRYGAAFIKEFSGSSQTLPLETVEFALERVFASKKYGRAVPELLLLSIREAANDVNKTKKKQVNTKPSRPQKMISDDTREVDSDTVISLCHAEFLEMEKHCIDVLLKKYHEVDDNNDGVLQFEEFSSLISQIDPTMDAEGVAGLYYECVGEDDVIDSLELVTLVTERGLLFNLQAAV